MSMEDTIRNNVTLDFTTYFQEELKTMLRTTYKNKAKKPHYTDRDIKWKYIYDEVEGAIEEKIFSEYIVSTKKKYLIVS